MYAAMAFLATLASDYRSNQPFGSRPITGSLSFRDSKSRWSAFWIYS
jgi:hypothetical protein